MFKDRQWNQNSFWFYFLISARDFLLSPHPQSELLKNKISLKSTLTLLYNLFWLFHLAETEVPSSWSSSLLVPAVLFFPSSSCCYIPFRFLLVSHCTPRSTGCHTGVLSALCTHPVSCVPSFLLFLVFPLCSESFFFHGFTWLLSSLPEA